MSTNNGVVQFTSTGLAELINAKQQGLKGAIKWIAAGSESYTPSAGQTALRAEKQREPVDDFEEISPTRLRMAAVFKGTREFEVREIGFFLASGTLLCVYSAPDTLLAYKSANANWLEKFTLDISPLPTDSVTIEAGNDNINLLMAGEVAKLTNAALKAMSRDIAQDEKSRELTKSLNEQAVSLETLKTWIERHIESADFGQKIKFQQLFTRLAEDREDILSLFQRYKEEISSRLTESEEKILALLNDDKTAVLSALTANARANLKTMARQLEILFRLRDLEMENDR
ncbi:phage tail protein [Veronia pacifica]|uniref:Phage tail fibre protein N-terminal domain-containing protein n=1 Tax=Veronia pacifica TaxID=1080227 RepID=A0A1C3E9G0_9GAMM|nr:phage tail protein [Veronia pacifica]ODA29856.1 hypothetical protein A8L45_21370 [Veronia pacifica]